MNGMKRGACGLMLSVLAGGLLAANPKPPPDPMADPLMITAGFLTHHPDMRYRLLGQEAYQAKKYEDALRFFRRASFYADKPSQGMVAEMLWNGQGTAQDRALAYAWMDLAAERGYQGFLGLRERYWSQLTEVERERAQAQGQDVYARYGDAAAQPRYEAQLRQGRRQLTGSRTGFTGNLRIVVPGTPGGQTIEGSRFYDERYWDAKKYWAYTDSIWARPRVGKVTVGDVEQAPSLPSRIDPVAPDTHAVEPDVPEAPMVPESMVQPGR